MRSLMFLHHKDSTQKEFKLCKINKQISVFASGEKTGSEGYEWDHQVVSLKHVARGMGV